MSYQSDIHNALSNAAAITAIVGSRIFADVADGSTTAPYLVFQFISTDSQNTHDGSRDVEFPLIQINCWATGKAAAITLANAVAAALDGKTIAGTSQCSFQFSNRFGTYESDTKLFGEILEYRASSITN